MSAFLATFARTANGPAAALGNLIHYSVGSFFTGSIVDNDGCAFGSELFGDVSADSPSKRLSQPRLFRSVFHFSLCFFHLLFLCSFYFFSIDLDFLCVDAFSIHSVNG